MARGGRGGLGGADSVDVLDVLNSWRRRGAVVLRLLLPGVQAGALGIRVQVGPSIWMGGDGGRTLRRPDLI
jgi:hypothetical protein